MLNQNNMASGSRKVALPSVVAISLLKNNGKNTLRVFQGSLIKLELILAA
jgi:hypothetical protein